MAWYRANARFEGWRPGEEFESDDERHASLAEKTSLLTLLPQWPEEAPEPEDGEDPPAGWDPQRSEDDGPGEAAEERQAWSPQEDESP